MEEHIELGRHLFRFPRAHKSQDLLDRKCARRSRGLSLRRSSRVPRDRKSACARGLGEARGQGQHLGPGLAGLFRFPCLAIDSARGKRLHDRARPVWIWYAYYTLALAVSLVPLKASLAAETNATSGFLAVPLAFFAGYIFFELGVFRGTPGPNAHGEAPSRPTITAAITISGAGCLRLRGASAVQNGGSVCSSL